MSDPNVLRTEWELDRTQTPIGMRAARVGAAAGAQRLGATVYELTPGGVVSPYHVHHGNEELLIVLSGTPTLRTADGDRVLEPGAVVSFLPGPGGEHRISNPGSEPARVLVVSTMEFPEIAEYPETGATLILMSAGQGKAFPAGSDGEFADLYMEAIRADHERDEEPE